MRTTDEFNIPLARRFKTYGLSVSVSPRRRLLAAGHKAVDKRQQLRELRRIAGEGIQPWMIGTKVHFHDYYRMLLLARSW